ncbi:diguanylate cyclase (GGDEF)-like protein [Halanaerobium saccharolyticum]|uniref:Diguanylate cyclase (GGDEF)-like protein n=2 Tax=Halanaerobium saccharolyticum TaxID=43595 RepID=A0A4R6L9X8_9FIRM|nr:diguanylate cyclase (GGDEF)-like protein [Halanaerobium saccharolyticum]
MISKDDLMDIKTEKKANKKLMTTIHIYYLILLLILIAKFMFWDVEHLDDYIFGFFYLIILFIIMEMMLKITFDKKTLFIWMGQTFFYTLFLFLEYHIIVKIFILYQVLAGAFASAQQIKIFKKQNEKVKFLSFHDEMTGLYNRRYFENKLQEFNNPDFYNLSVIIADINNLKIINDNYGHKKGDQYIKETADLLKSVTREKDIISRIGGDEFAIILPDTNKKECSQIIKRIKKKAKKHPEKYFSIAFGYIYNSQKYKTLEAMINAADRKMYHNKKEIKQKLNLNFKRENSWNN